MTIALVLVRAVHLASLMVLFGTEALGIIVSAGSEEPINSRHLRCAMPWLACVALVTAVLWLALVACEITGGTSLQSIWSVAIETLFGRVFLIRIAALATLVLLTFVNCARGVRCFLAGTALAALAATSHAAAAGNVAFMPVRAAIDAVHLVAAGFWLGGLVQLLMLGIEYRATPHVLLRPLRLFSRWGTIAVGLLIVAGSVNALLILSGEQGMWSFGYISLLAAKIVLAAVMVALALVNRLHLVPDMQRGMMETYPQLLLTMTGEFALGLLIVAIVGTLGVMSPWMVMQ